MSRILIHPGFHKTGTSFLQQSVFADERFFNSLLSHQEAHNLLVGPSPFEFNVEDVKRRIADAACERRHGAADVISSEILSGTMFQGSRDASMIAERLKEVCPDARILLTVRSQTSLAKSVYLQYVNRGGRRKVEHFFRHQPEPGYHWFSPRVFQFHNLIEYYAALFGKDNVIVLPQELLKKDRSHYLRLLFEFADLQFNKETDNRISSKAVGKSPPASGIPILRAGNLFRQTPLNPEGITRLALIGNSLGRLAFTWRVGAERADRKLSDRIRAEVAGKYGLSNSRTQKFCPVDLSKLGYEVAA